ncbi:hypothetical protein AXK11_02595 [Cephaloticoccus primus]|uniref:Uncharacterized protein n=1 Tax=Cephaloticoccus primus TaxID=1548207 RepID=A0A139SS98_9BACT|nr:hypothetical protein [Cephaloticoccus primus]KXU37350.1 hypothetical protein AXK11_02595 [Cephaloticoccus primus]
MKKLILIIFLGFWGQVFAVTGEIRSELPVGTTFSIKTDFLVYEIKGKPPYGKNNHYVMDSDRGGGIGGRKWQYRGSFPAGARFEVVSLIKKNKRNWIYTVKPKGGDALGVGDATLFIHPASMRKVTWGKQLFSHEPLNEKRVELDPDLFTDFIYPEE